MIVHVDISKLTQTSMLCRVLEQLNISLYEDNLKFKFKFKQTFMEARIASFQDSDSSQKCNEFPEQSQEMNKRTSQDILEIIFDTLNSPRNQRDSKPYKMSISIQETHQTNPTKCNCKKSKCLKLYCQCFAQGSFCNGCNCFCCLNTQDHSEIRAKAIDQVLIKSLVPFGHKNSSIKGCNCKKTGCQKKYCECFSSGDKCSQYCKCQSCLNS